MVAVQLSLSWHCFSSPFKFCGKILAGDGQRDAICRCSSLQDNTQHWPQCKPDGEWCCWLSTMICTPSRCRNGLARFIQVLNTGASGKNTVVEQSRMRVVGASSSGRGRDGHRVAGFRGIAHTSAGHSKPVRTLKAQHQILLDRIPHTQAAWLLLVHCAATRVSPIGCRTVFQRTQHGGCGSVCVPSGEWQSGQNQRANDLAHEMDNILIHPRRQARELSQNGCDMLRPIHTQANLFFYSGQSHSGQANLGQPYSGQA